ncbi:hypothetical protein KXD40_009631 [Peronospora effusa]|uniref:Uncharacterized protein n=1 Tax=Peronospora effusa TaxID=542832 RepID=A0A3M6VCQ0_9STRA|nr:hypothetical protein DD238_005428 [Peronospora effusa]RQM14322.1 hypothetical protein DD237_003707 [Peronospora effusa]UIZ23685.1 hypothetical protein KXD40_009631 [Peronospora effusa]CAI5706013.1 unnamed protein product [Peronospora effusa]
MSSSVIIGVIVLVLVLVGVTGFYVYRFMRIKHRKDDDKHVMQDYSVSKVNNTMESNQVFATNIQSTPSSYDFTTLDIPSTKATPDPLASSIAMLHAVPGSSPSPSQEPVRYNFDPAQSTVNGAVPSTSPFNRKDNLLASRPSNSNFDDQSMEFNAATGSYAESYTESYAGSFAGSIAGSYANSFSGTYNGQGVLNSFDGSVEDFTRDTVGTTVSEALERQSQLPPGDGEQSHWMNDMRGTNDSYAMLESGSFDRTSALSRFSTDSDLTGRPTQT